MSDMNIKTKLENGITISTIYALDVKMWETALFIKDKWLVAERYENESRALEGHEKWAKHATENPELDISKENEKFFNEWKELTQESKSVYVPIYKYLPRIP
jgi:hypothetical protein